MKKVLIISYLFPPLDCNVGRQYKIAKYLPSYGWKPIVLTVKKSRIRPLYDYSLLEDIHPEAKIYRTFSFEVRFFLRCFCKLLGTKDPYLSWLPFAIFEGIKIIRKEKPDVLFSTLQPSVNHVVGLILKKISRLPWIADFRDAWTQNPFKPYLENFLNIDHRLEATVIKNADLVTAVTESLLRGLSQKYPKEPKNKFVTIAHGFDPEDFKNIEKKPTDKFIITHAGSLFKEHRYPQLFFEVIKEMIEHNEIDRNNFEIQFIGRIAYEKEIARRLNIQDIVKISGYLTHKEAFPKLVNSDILLLMIDLRGKITVTGKLFEYMASGTPILALIPLDGEAAKLIKETNIGIVVHPEDKQQIRRALSFLYKNRKGKLQPRQGIIEQYDVKLKVRKLAEMLDKLCLTRGLSG